MKPHVVTPCPGGLDQVGCIVAFDRGSSELLQSLFDLALGEVSGAMQPRESREHLDVEMCRRVQRGRDERLGDGLADRAARQQVDHCRGVDH